MKTNIAISAHDIIYFNKDCINKYFKDRKYMLLYYDKRKKKISISPVLTKNKNSLTLYTKGMNRHSQVCASAFFKHHNIMLWHYKDIQNQSSTKRFKCRWNCEHQAIEIRL